MKVNENVMFNFFLKVSLIAVSGFLLLFDNIFLHITSLVIIVIGSMVMVRFDIFHPYVWYGGIYLLYSISYPILYLMESVHAQIGYSNELIIMEWIAYSTFFVIVKSKRVINFKIDRIYKPHPINKYIMIILSFIIIMILFYLSALGDIKKSDLDSNLIAGIGERLVLIFLILYAMSILGKVNKSSGKLLMYIFMSFIPIFLFFLFTGERDYIYRFLLITFFIIFVFSTKKIRKKLYLIIPLFITSLPLVNKIKFLGLRGELSESNESFIESFLISDFHAASRNIQTLINNKDYWDFFYGYTFLMDIINVFKLSFLNKHNFATIRWFNESFFSENRAGQGFTTVGEGYINFGYFGIVFLFIIISIMINYLYVNSWKSNYRFIIYLFSIPIFMYSTRADLANIISPLINYIVITLIIIWIAEQLSKGIFKY